MRRLASAVRAPSFLVGVGRFSKAQPRLAAWIVLSAGVCAGLAIGGRNAAVPLGPWLVLFAVGIVVAGACVWIVAGEEEGDGAAPSPSASPASAEAGDSAGGGQPDHL